MFILSVETSCVDRASTLIAAGGDFARDQVFVLRCFPTKARDPLGTDDVNQN